MPQFRKRPTKRAQELRNNATPAERTLWRCLSKRHLSGHKFTRQAPVGPFVCDFLCRERGLVVEVDGGQHAEMAAADATRTNYLEQQGFQVLRFWNNDVLQNTESVLEAILAELDECESKFTRAHPQPASGSDRLGDGPLPGAPASGRGLT